MGPYIANIPEIQENYLSPPQLNPVVVGDGQCVAFVEKVTGAGRTPGWTQGSRVAGDLQIAAGTAIATFDSNGRYGNHTDGRSHAAIYVSQDGRGIVVYDQWLGQPVHQRTIRFPPEPTPGHAVPKAVNDASQYYVVK
jgi:hypothetical protein